MQIRVDADACPKVIKEILYRAAERTRVPVILVANKTEAMTSIGKRLQSRIDTEEIRINRYADQLHKQFTQMDTAVAGWNAQANYLARF